VKDAKQRHLKEITLLFTITMLDSLKLTKYYFFPGEELQFFPCHQIHKISNNGSDFMLF